MTAKSKRCCALFARQPNYESLNGIPTAETVQLRAHIARPRLVGGDWKGCKHVTDGDIIDHLDIFLCRFSALSRHFLLSSLGVKPGCADP